jgi:nitrate/TMAO reductase-like tetraheme cytochrome c subunit
MPEPSNGERRHWRSRLWAAPRHRWLLGIPLGGFLALALGAVGLGSINWIVHKTSSNEFCFGCHSHEQFIKPEYLASTQFRTAAGVRADCADCHLPHDDWFELMFTKVVVSADIVPEFMGKIATREKYEAERGRLAQQVWAQFLANDSKFCRSCHAFEAMDLEGQGRMPSRRHARAIEQGMTCIECHRGIVHDLPENDDALWDAIAPQEPSEGA